MSTSLSYPSAVFPEFPALTVDHPDEWEALVVANTVLACGAPLEVGTFRPNVCVSVTRYPGTASVTDVAEGIALRLESADDFAEVGREYVTVLEQPGYRMEGSFSMEGVGTVYQAVNVAVLHHGSVTDVVEAVASCTASQAEALVPVLRTILASLRSSGAAPAAPSDGGGR